MVNFKGDLEELSQEDKNSNLKKQNKEHNHKNAEDNFIDDNLINRDNLKTLKLAEDLIKRKSQMNNPYMNQK